MRQKKMALSNQETSKCNPDRKSRDKDFLTPTETAQYLGVCRTYIYDSINRGKIKETRIGRKTLISKADIQAMFDFLSPKESEPKETTVKKGKALPTFTPAPRFERNSGSRIRGFTRWSPRIMCPRPFFVARHISAKVISTDFSRREKRIRKLLSGIRWRIFSPSMG